MGYYITGDFVKYWGTIRAFWGRFRGRLLGSSFFAIPGIERVSVADELVGWIGEALEGAEVVDGLTAIGAGLVGMRIPKEGVVESEPALKTDRFLLMVYRSAAAVGKARGSLECSGAVHAAVHAGEGV